MVNDAQSQRVFIFDPCFGGLTGHWENYCKRLCQELSNRQYEVIIFGQENYQPSMVSSLSFHAIFSASPFFPAKNMADLQAIKKLFLHDFSKIDTKQFRKTDIFMFHSIYPTYFNAIIEWTNAVVSHLPILSLFVFQFPPSDTKKHISLLKKMYYRLRRLLLGESLSVRDLEWSDNNHVRFYQQSIPLLSKLAKNTHVLCANSEGLAKNYSLLFGVNVHPIPMPGPILNEMNTLLHSTKLPTALLESNRIKIGYFGHACIDKGAALLEEVIVGTLKKYDHVEFHIHANPNDDAKVYFDNIQSINSSHLTLYKGHIQESLMLALIQQMDIIILPYSPKKYATCPSAVFMEALIFGKMMVIPSATWMDETAEQYGIAVQRFDKFKAGAVIQALALAITEHASISVSVNKVSQLYLAKNNIVRYLDKIFEAAHHLKRANN